MPLSDQVRSLAQAGAAMRRDIFSQDQDGEAQMARMTTGGALPFACYFSADKSGELSLELGFKETHDFILRVDKTENSFDPTIGKSVVLINAVPPSGDLTVRLTTIANSPMNPEWVIGCKNEF